MHLSLSPQRPAFSHTGNSPSPTRTLRSFEHSSSEMGFLHSCHHHRPAVSRECPRKYSGLQQRTAEFRTRVAGRTLHELQDNATGSANNTAGANSTAARCNRPSRGLLPIERANWSNSFEPFFFNTAFVWVLWATPEKSKEHPNLRILPFPQKWQDAVWTLRYAGGMGKNEKNGQKPKGQNCEIPL